MSKYKVVLFDVDGVLLQPQGYFSHAYAKERGLDKKRFDDMFAKYATPAVKGDFDYKTMIEVNKDIWQWDGTTEELLDKWFSWEGQPVSELIELIKDLKQTGVLVYLATDQDKYRAKYLSQVLFKDLFHGAFISSNLGHTKVEPEFFEKVLEDLGEIIPGIKPVEIAFFDDLQHNIDSAKAQGISACLYESPAQVINYLTS